MIGADSLGGSSASWNDVASTKLYRPRTWLAFGFTTSWRYGQLLGHGVHDELPPSKVCLPAIARDGAHEWIVRTLVPAMRKVLKDGGYATRKDEHEEGGTAVVAVRDTVVRVQDDYAVLESRAGYIACGSGQDDAIVAARAARDLDPLMPPADLAAFALRHAELANPWVRSPFHFIKTQMQ